VRLIPKILQVTLVKKKKNVISIGSIDGTTSSSSRYLTSPTNPPPLASRDVSSSPSQSSAVDALSSSASSPPSNPTPISAAGAPANIPATSTPASAPVSNSVSSSVRRGKIVHESLMVGFKREFAVRTVGMLVPFHSPLLRKKCLPRPRDSRYSSTSRHTWFSLILSSYSFCFSFLLFVCSIRFFLLLILSCCNVHQTKRQKKRRIFIKGTSSPWRQFGRGARAV